MWSSRLATYCAFSLTLLFPAAAFPHHPYSEYDPTVAPWIGVALSGGGLRAAAFSHGVMLELRKLCLIRPQEQSSDQNTPEDNSPPYSLHYLEDTEYADDDRASPCGRGGGASFLDNVNFLSGVSGGAITAAYYKTHPDQLMEFSQKLKDARLAWKLFTSEKTTPIWRPPVMLGASILDTLFQTFKLPLSPIPEIEVAPFATMTLYGGLFESEQLAHVYSDLFLNKTTFGELERPTKSSPTLAGAVLGNRRKEEKGIGQANLLINATDIANGQIFTFDKETFACLGSIDDFRKLPLAVGVAASSTLPGVFSPLNLKAHVPGTDSKRIPTSCPLILGDQVRSPILVDGGVSDNLGVTGLLRSIFGRKNKNSLQKDDNNISYGKTLDILESEQFNITRSLLSKKDRKLLPTVQIENPKSQKTFLLIVNAGVTATSSLPKLAGYLDNSFDVLIRDRTDLSRVIAQRLLGNFGFGVVELNMRDLVKNNRVVSRIVKFALANQQTAKLTDEPVRQIAQTFDFTEMERKVHDDLNQVGLLPSKDEIETLILAGRAVVAEMSGSIKKEYEKLVDKNYSASCDSIINPDRHYCWHPSFETPHLAANKVGVLLDVLTRTSGDFSRKVSENQSNQLAQIKNNLLNLYLDESRAIEDLTEWITATNWRTMQACLIRRNNDFTLARRGEPVFKVPVCSIRELTDAQKVQLLEDAPGWLNDFHLETDDGANNPRQDLEEYVSELLNSDIPSPDFSQKYKVASKWVAGAIKHMLNNEGRDMSPTYYCVLARFLILQNKFEDGFYYLYKGVTSFPDDPELSYLLGYYSIHLNHDFQGGLKHLAAAIEKARSNQQQIDLLPRKQLEEDDRATLRMWFSRAQDRYTLRSAKYTVLSSIPFQGRSEFVTNEEVDSWLNQTFPDGHGGNDLSTLLRFAEQLKPVPQSMVSGLVCRTRKTLEKMSLRDTVRVSITEFLNAYGEIKCPNNQGGDIDGTSSLKDVDLLMPALCGDIDLEEPLSTRHRSTPCRHFAKVQLTIRELLAPKTAVTYARAQARKLYESHPGTQPSYLPYYWERADVYGLIVLLDAIQKECPQRDEDARTAQRLFHEAGTSVGEDGRLNGTFLFHKGVQARIVKLENAAKELACSRRHMD